MPVTHAKNVTIADWAGVVTVANSTGGTTTDQASNLARPSDWNSAHAVNLSASEVAPIFQFSNGLSSTTAAGGITVGINSVRYFEPIPACSALSLSRSQVNGSLHLQPFYLPFALGSGQLNILAANSSGFLNGAAYSAASTGSVSSYQTVNQWLVLYTLGTGNSSTMLQSFWQSNGSILASWDRRVSTANTSSGTIFNGLTLSFPAQFDTDGGVTYSSTAQTGTTAFGTSTAASTRADGLITGAAIYMQGNQSRIFGINVSCPAGIYWLGHLIHTSTSSTGTSGGQPTAGTMFSTQSVLKTGELPVGSYKRIGVSVSNSTQVGQLFHGALATTSSAPTSVIATSDIRFHSEFLYWNYANTSY